MGSPVDLKAIRARAEKATPGPWRSQVIQDVGEMTEFAVVEWANEDDGDGPLIFTTEEYDIADLRRAGVKTSPGADAAFVAASRSDVPALLDEVERQAAEIERLRDVLYRKYRATRDEIHGAPPPKGAE